MCFTVKGFRLHTSPQSNILNGLYMNNSCKHLLLVQLLQFPKGKYVKLKSDTKYCFIASVC